MNINFDKDYLSELYYLGKCTSKKYRFQPSIVKAYVKRIDLLNTISDIEELYQYNSLCYEVLQGDKKGLSSIRVNDQYRIEFKASEAEDNEVLITICTIIELSNHYK